MPEKTVIKRGKIPFDPTSKKGDMYMKSKRILAAGLAMVLSVTALAGCGGETASNNNTAGGKDANGEMKNSKSAL